MLFAWALVFLFAGFLGCVEEYRAIQQGRALTPWGSACHRELSPRSFWALTSLGIAGSTASVVIGMLLVLA